MFRHANIWRAIDRLARSNGLSPSGLARRAGLDPTTFNPSKRQTAGGRTRWPSTESLAKILDATSTSIEQFVSLLDDAPRSMRPRRLPVIGYAQAGSQGYFDDAGFPAGSGWDEVEFPDLTDPHAYALEVAGDSMLPVFRDGDRIIVSPAADIRRGDRVVVKTCGGEVMAKELARMTANVVDLKSLNPAFEDRSLRRSDIDWIARIIWASQ